MKAVSWQQESPTRNHSGNIQRKTSQDDPDVVKAGYLHIKRPPCNPRIRLKAWQKKFLVLRDVSVDNGVSTMEIFESEASFEANPQGGSSFMLDLNNVTHLESYLASKRFPNAFMVVRRGQSPLLAGCTCPIEKNSWMQAIGALADKRKLVCMYNDVSIASDMTGLRRGSLPVRLHYEVNPLYGNLSESGNRSTHDGSITPTKSSGPPTMPRDIPGKPRVTHSNATNFSASKKCERDFLVQVQPTSAADRNRLHGDHYMNISSCYVTLTEVESGKESLRWPIRHINRFKCEDLKRGQNLVILEASVFCGPSEGSYQFKTHKGNELVQLFKGTMSRPMFVLNKLSSPPSTHKTLEIGESAQSISHSQDSPVQSPLERSYAQKEELECAEMRCNSNSLYPGLFNIERSQSTPNLFETTEDKALGSATRVTEFKSVTEKHSYLELVVDEITGSTPQAHCFKINHEIIEQRRDSGFNDSECEEWSKPTDTPPPLPPKRNTRHLSGNKTTSNPLPLPSRLH